MKYVVVLAMMFMACVLLVGALFIVFHPVREETLVTCLVDAGKPVLTP